MGSPVRKVALIGRFVDPRVAESMGVLLPHLKKRGVQVVPDELRKRLALKGDEEATLVLTRVAGQGTALLVEPF